MDSLPPEETPAEIALYPEDSSSRPNLLDKKAFHEIVDQEVIEAQIVGRHLRLFLVDINSFKAVNDTLGHLTGDVVIDEVEEIMITTPGLMASHTGSLGGDEYAALAEVDEEQATEIVTHLRVAFEKYLSRPESRELRDLGLGLAIGVGTLGPGMTGLDLFREADQAMYRDKISQVELTEEQAAFLREFQKRLEEHNLRIRDLGKYLLFLSNVEDQTPKPS